MKNNIILEIAHLLLSQYITKEDIMIDATMGNGNDTVYLANLAKKVYAFDIQEQALIETRKKVNQLNLTNVELILDSHEHIIKYVDDFKGVVFNLGYLPNSDKTVTTTKETTLDALNQILPRLKVYGFIQLVIYTGHKQGMIESKAIEDYLKQLDPKQYKILKIDLPYQTNNPPYILMIIKEKDEG